MKRAFSVVVGLGLMAGSIVLAAPGQAATNRYWMPPDLCDGISDYWYKDAYAQGLCAAAVSPQQTVAAKSSLQYLVSCQDAPTTSVGAYGNTGPYWQSLGFLYYGANFSTGYAEFTSSTGGAYISEAKEIGSASGGNSNADGSVTAWGATPVKVSNFGTASSTATFAAACLNTSGVTSFLKWSPNVVRSGDRVAVDTVERHVESSRRAMEAAALRTAGEFATGERKRDEFQVMTWTKAGLEVHDRINLRSGRTERARLICPKGMVRSGGVQTSYGFDALKNVSGHMPRITAKRSSSDRGVTMAYAAKKLTYPTVAYTVISCREA